MNKFIITNKHANMVNVRLRFEEDQISRFEVILADQMACTTLFQCGSRQMFMNYRGNNSARKGGTINALKAISPQR